MKSKRRTIAHPMDTHVKTLEVDRLIDECESTNKTLWEYNTREQPQELLQEFEDQMEVFREAARRALVQEEVIQPAGVSTMLKFLTETSTQNLEKKIDAVSILFQTMHLRLQRTFCMEQTSAQPAAQVPSLKDSKLRSLDARFAMRKDIPELTRIGEQTNNLLLHEDRLMPHLISKNGGMILGMNGFSGDIASYAIYNLGNAGIDFVEVNNTPEYGDTKAATYLLRQFDWWIPHNILQTMSRFLTTAPINIGNEKETTFFGASDFIAFGGERDNKGDLTHVRLGKLTDEFETWKNLGHYQDCHS
jgi:hypothetical protein